jgi:hypothetical protein
VGPRGRAAADRPAAAYRRLQRAPPRGRRSRVAVLPFGQIGADVVSAETAGAATLDEWLASHRAFYAGCRDEIALLLGEPGWRLTDGEPMVVTSFRLAE